MIGRKWGESGCKFSWTAGQKNDEEFCTVLKLNLVHKIDICDGDNNQRNKRPKVSHQWVDSNKTVFFEGNIATDFSSSSIPLIAASVVGEIVEDNTIQEGSKWYPVYEESIKTFLPFDRLIIQENSEVL